MNAPSRERKVPASNEGVIVMKNKSVGLEKMIEEFLLTSDPPTMRKHDETVLSAFVRFVEERNIPWQDVFTLDTLHDFDRATRLRKVSSSILRLSQDLFRKGKIRDPIGSPTYQQPLPQLYEDYLSYREKVQQIASMNGRLDRRLLCAFHFYLKRSDIELGSVGLEQVDPFLAGLHKRFSPSTCRCYRSILRGFLRYLYHNRKIIRADLAPLIVAPPCFDQPKPPKFLRPGEVQILFSTLNTSSPGHIRTSAMAHLAYTLGLRPQEISSIRLDDISFRKAELLVRERKNRMPATLPLPEKTLQAIAAYLIGVRPQSEHRALFLSLYRPYRPVVPQTVVHAIRNCMRKAKVPGSAYWLRHTYAQNLLESGVTIFGIKEMLGHHAIESTKKYLYIHTKLMREVLFGETL